MVRRYLSDLYQLTVIPAKAGTSGRDGEGSISGSVKEGFPIDPPRSFLPEVLCFRRGGQLDVERVSYRSLCPFLPEVLRLRAG